MNDFSKVFAEVPPSLVTKVNGVATEDGFKYIGSCIADGIEESLKLGSAKPLSAARQVLDFGSGLGRVILHLLNRAPTAEITGFDIDPMMIQWSSRLVADPRTRFVTSTLDLPNDKFDLITVVSVFTHLDATTDFWLSEVQRLLSPSGCAFITYQDDTLFAEMQEKGHIPASVALDGKYVVGKGSAGGARRWVHFIQLRIGRVCSSDSLKWRASAPAGSFNTSRSPW